MFWCNKHGMHSFLGAYIMGKALVFYFIWALGLKCVFTSQVCFYEGCEGSLFPPCFKWPALWEFFLPWFAVGCRQGGRRGREFRWPPVGAGCFGETTRQKEPLRLLENLHQAWALQRRGAHLFSLKTIRGRHCGQRKPVIKSFLGLEEGRLGRSDLSALCRVDWRVVEFDVYRCGIPISLSKQERLDQSRLCPATGWG